MFCFQYTQCIEHELQLYLQESLPNNFPIHLLNLQYRQQIIRASVAPHPYPHWSILDSLIILVGINDI